VAPKSLHDSGHVVDPPKCHPGTRVAIIQTIIDWIAGSNEANRDKLFTWLTGAAGAGKSAIGRNVCERCKEEGTLLASFFFGSRDSTRNHSRSFVATIAYQICSISPGVRKAVSSAIEYDPFVFDRSLQTQLTLLVMNPLLENFANEPHLAPCLIVVDGLDECLDQASQRDILNALLHFATTSTIQIRVLVCSRQESHIITMFSAIQMNALLFKILLDREYSSMRDIALYLHDQFQQIRDTHIFKASIPASWPSHDQLDKLKYKSSGQFIYATTVVRYVESSRHRPQQRLDAILGLRPPFKDLPFSELDALYLHLLNGTDDASLAANILGFLALYNSMCSADIDTFLGLDSGEAEVFLSRLTAIVELRSESSTPACLASLLHKSFEDFLFDSSRSKGLSKTRTETRAWHSLRVIEIFSGKRFSSQLPGHCSYLSFIPEHHDSCRFQVNSYDMPLCRKLLQVDSMSYESWSTSAQSSFLNALENFPMNTYCKEIFSHSISVRVSYIFPYFSLFISHFSLLCLCRYLISFLCLIIF